MQVQHFPVPKPDMIAGEWRSPRVDAQARLEVVVANAAEGGGATAEKQDEQTAVLVQIRDGQSEATLVLDDILTGLGPLAKDVTVEQVRDAIIALGDGATLATVAAAVADVQAAIEAQNGGATEVTAAAILAELQTVVSRLDVPLSTLASEITATAIKEGVDGLEGIGTATNTKLDEVKGKQDTGNAALAAIQTNTGTTATNTTAIAADTASSAANLSNIAPGIPDALGAGGGMKIEGVAGGTAIPISAGALPLPAGAATNAAIDDLEVDADATRVATEALNTKVLAALGTDFATPARGTATVTAAQLPSSSTPRGFTLENIDASADLWVGTDNTVTTANGFRISPSRSRFFDLGNPNTLWVISASTTAWQIGAVS